MTDERGSEGRKREKGRPAEERRGEKRREKSAVDKAIDKARKKSIFDKAAKAVKNKLGRRQTK